MMRPSPAQRAAKHFAWNWLLPLALVIAPAAAAREPEGYPELRRELEIGAEVLRASLDEAMPESRRVLGVDAGYLADQGVLVIVELASPWFRMNTPDIEVNPGITSLEEIPEMVQEILTELNLGLSRHQAEELKELREIRALERAARAEQRALRAEIRETRRQLQQAEPGPEADALQQRRDALERELAAAEDEERALAQDAASARESLNVPPGSDPEAPRVDLDRAVAESVCAYGATFKSVPARQRLNVLVKQPRSLRFFVFAMSDVRECQAGEITADALLAGSLAYDG